MYQSVSNDLTHELYILNQFEETPTFSASSLVEVQTDISDTFFRFTKPVRLTNDIGIALVVLSDKPDDPSTYQSYILNQSITILPNVAFNTLAITDTCSVYLEPTEQDKLKTIRTSKQLKVKRSVPQLLIEEIYSVTFLNKDQLTNYVIKNGDFYTLCITVDGEILHEFNDSKLKAKRHNFILYGHHSHSSLQKLEKTSSVLVISFQAKGIQENILNQLSYIGKRDSNLIQNLLEIIHHSNNVYSIDEIECYLKFILVKMMYGEHLTEQDYITSMRKNYESDLFDSMITFLKENIEEKNEVRDLVKEFSLSRSTIQSLFKKYAQTTPKNYINQLRLNRSKVLIRESQMNLSEIAERLGYGSIQYFSRAFSREFGISPSVYAKSIQH